jgi:four helix bundle protein
VQNGKVQKKEKSMILQKTKNNEFRDNLKKRLVRYSLDVIAFVEGLPRTPSAIILGKQLLRSATSVGANYFEAQAANSRKDFTNFLTIALKSANESEYWFILFIDGNIGSKSKSEYLYSETIELAKILGSIVKSLRQ